MRQLLLLTLLAPAAFAESPWPQFRGPGGTGISPATGLPTKFDDKTNVVWKTPIHDQGWSSPVILGKNVWLTTARDDGTAQYAVAIDRDSGKVVHDVKVFDTPKPPYFFKEGFNSHASPTPVVEDGRVYVHFGSAGTACLDPDTGKILWANRDLPCDHFRAPGSSPILWKDLLIVAFDGHDQQYVAALFKDTGKVAWRTDRTVDYKTKDGDLKKAYSTATVIDVGGKPQLVSSCAAGTVAYDPKGGKELWKVEYAGMNAATPPLYAHGLVYITSGHTAMLYAVDPTGAGNVTKTNVKWSVRSAPSRCAPIVLGDLLLMVNDGGFASGHDATTGKELWRRRLFGKNWYSSPIVADGHLYICDRDGKCHVLTADREGKLVATNALEGGIQATPAVAGKSLYIRTDKYLYRIEQK
jgi:outer membrane protein assembly factor BamB